jgi:four helix bundle protein
MLSFWVITLFNGWRDRPNESGDGRWKIEVRIKPHEQHQSRFPTLPHQSIILDMMTFEDLESWQKASETVREIYALTRQEPLQRDFGLCGQLQRAAVSIMSNIAEGFERRHLPEKIQAYNIVRGSTAELRSLLYVVEDNFPEGAQAVTELRKEIVAIGKLVTGLLRSTEQRKSSSSSIS